MQKLLLHTCCAPCSAYVLELLKKYEVCVFYFNPNIDTPEEYEKRKNECEKYCKKNNIPFIEHFSSTQPARNATHNVTGGEHGANNKEWQLYIEGLEDEPEGGKRCVKCFDLRLSKTAKFASDNGFELFATTLSISPHKNSATINIIGNRVAEQFGIKFLGSDWKKGDGYKKSCEISKQEGFYRQNYCGCKYSKK